MRKVKFKIFIPTIYVAFDGSEYDTYGKANIVNRESKITPVPAVKIKEGTQKLSDFDNDGIFHAWSTEGTQEEMLAVAIIELEDGSIKTIQAEHIKFIS